MTKVYVSQMPKTAEECVFSIPSNDTHFFMPSLCKLKLDTTPKDKVDTDHALTNPCNCHVQTNGCPFLRLAKEV